MKQIPINQNVLSLSEYNQRASALLVAGRAHTADYDYAQFLIGSNGDVLGGVVWESRQNIIETTPRAYIHS